MRLLFGLRWGNALKAVLLKLELTVLLCESTRSAAPGAEAGVEEGALVNERMIESIGRRTTYKSPPPPPSTL